MGLSAIQKSVQANYSKSGFFERALKTGGEFGKNEKMF